MDILIDMNLPPRWAQYLAERGHGAVHWSSVGDVRADDTTLMAWARQYQHVVFTHDLDFGALLAVTGADGPSVIPVRTQDVTPDAIGELVVRALNQFNDDLVQGALVVVEEHTNRVRVLPIRR